MPHPFLHDMAVHHFDLLRACTGLDCQQVMAVGVRPPWSMYKGLPGIEAILTFNGGLVVSNTGTMVARGFTTPVDGLLTLVGEKGTLRLEVDSQVRFYGEKGELEVVPPVTMEFSDTAYALREFPAAIRHGRKPETHVEENVRTLAMVEAAITSVESRRPVAVSPLVDAVLRA